MSRPRPKFCVGEEVLLMTLTEGCCKTEVTGIQWAANGIGGITGKENGSGWRYWVTAYGGYRWTERRLKKLPPEERTQWEDCAWQPTKQGVEA